MSKNVSYELIWRIRSSVFLHTGETGECKRQEIGKLLQRSQIT